jgi:hypothetical protein
VTTKENDVKAYYCNEVMEYNGKINLYSIAEGKVDVTSYDKKSIEIISIYMTEKRNE